MLDGSLIIANDAIIPTLTHESYEPHRQDYRRTKARANMAMSLFQDFKSRCLLVYICRQHRIRLLLLVLSWRWCNRNKPDQFASIKDTCAAFFPSLLVLLLLLLLFYPACLELNCTMCSIHYIIKNTVLLFNIYDFTWNSKRNFSCRFSISTIAEKVALEHTRTLRSHSMLHLVRISISSHISIPYRNELIL